MCIKLLILVLVIAVGVGLRIWHWKACNHSHARILAHNWRVFRLCNRTMGNCKILDSGLDRGLHYTMDWTLDDHYRIFFGTPVDVANGWRQSWHYKIKVELTFLWCVSGLQCSWRLVQDVCNVSLHHTSYWCHT